MSKSSSFKNNFLKILFNNISLSGLGDASGILASAAAGNIYIRLHTSAVVVDDNTVGTEAAYVGYVAGGVLVPRTAGGWSIVGNNSSNAAAISFGACTAGSELIRYVSLWKNNSSNLESGRLYWGQLNSDLAVSVGITPAFAISALDVNEN